MVDHTIPRLQTNLILMCQEVDAQNIPTCLHLPVHLGQDLAMINIPRLTVEIVPLQDHTNRVY